MLSTLIKKLGRREDLTLDEAAGAMAVVMRGDAVPAQLGGFLVALAMKGERAPELVGFARTMRAHAVQLPTSHADLVDTCGTGGDGSQTFNVSTASALVLAACGVRVAKHGNRAVSSRCGSADLLEAVGVRVSAPPAVAARCLDEVGLAFLFAPTFHPATRHAAHTRKELGVRTAFNLLGPLTNPAAPRYQIVGVPRPELTELLARALLALGAERAWVVHGADGLDEISTSGYTKISQCARGTVRTFYVHPADFGLTKAPVDALTGGDAAANAQTLRSLLQGGRGAVRDVVLLNAGAALFVAGRAPSVRAGIAGAAHAIDSGLAAGVLDKLVAISQAGVPS